MLWTGERRAALKAAAERSMLTVPRRPPTWASQTTLYEQLRRGAIDLRADRIGGQWRISRVNLDRYLADQGEPVAS